MCRSVEDGKLDHSLLPIPGGSAPIDRDIAQGQPDQFGGGIITGEMLPGLDDLAQLRIDVFYGVGRINDPAHCGREREEGNHPIPGVTPGGGYHREFLPPGALLKGIEFGLGRLGTGRGIDRANGCGQRPAILPAVGTARPSPRL